MTRLKFNILDDYHLEITEYPDGSVWVILEKRDYEIQDRKLLIKLEELFYSTEDSAEFTERVGEELNWYEYNHPELSNLGHCNIRKELLLNIQSWEQSGDKLTIEYIDIRCMGGLEVKGKYAGERARRTGNKEGYVTLDQLNFNYDNGYGFQELYGVIYCRDSKGNPVWLTRWEYDGSEGWEFNSVPEYYK